MRKMGFYWKSNPDWWYRKENGVCVLKDTAPKEAKESYERYLKQWELASKEKYMD